MKQTKSMLSLLLIFTLCISGCNYQKNNAKAADPGTVMIFYADNKQDAEALPANTPIVAKFSIASPGQIMITISSQVKTTMTVQITDSSGNMLFDGTYSETDLWSETIDATTNLPWYDQKIGNENPALGTYTITVTFAADTRYVMECAQQPAATASAAPAPTPPQAAQASKPYLSDSNLMITKGFAHKVKVQNTSEHVSWSSNNKAVAQVNNKGKIKAKKVGTALIKARLDNGYELLCKVTVKKNECKFKKTPPYTVPFSKTALNVYKVYYDKKGNMILKTRIINRNEYKLSYLKNVKLRVKSQNGKNVATYSASRVSGINLGAGKVKKHSFKIKKSKLKPKKKADLRYLSGVKVSGKAYYTSQR